MVLGKLVRRNCGRKLPVSIKYQNVHSFKEGIIFLCQSILEMRRISHLHGSALFTIPYNPYNSLQSLKTISIWCVSQFISKANQLIGFYMMATLAFNELKQLCCCCLGIGFFFLILIVISFCNSFQLICYFSFCALIFWWLFYNYWMLFWICVLLRISLLHPA